MQTLKQTMTTHLVAVLGAVLITLLPESRAANTRDFLTVQIEGQKQGLIPGELTSKGNEKLWEVFAFNHEIVSPRDAATGLASGKRMHKPLKLVVKVGTTTPLLMNAIVNNENLTKVTFKLYHPDSRGQRVLYLTITLTNASISDITSWLPNRVDPVNDAYSPFHEISFTYQKIEWRGDPGGVVGQDDWQVQVQ